MKSIFVLAFILGLTCCQLTERQNIISCIRQKYSFSDEVVKTLESHPQCSRFYDEIVKEQSLRKNSNFATVTECLKSLSDVASEPVKQLINVVVKCTIDSPFPSLEQSVKGITNKIANDCIDKVKIPDQYYSYLQFEECVAFKKNRLESPPNELVNYYVWLKCRQALPQNNNFDVSNTYISSINSCVVMGRVVPSKEINTCISSLPSNHSFKENEFCKWYNEDRLASNDSYPIDYWYFLACYKVISTHNSDELNYKAGFATCTITGKSFLNKDVNVCINQVNIPDSALPFYLANPKCQIFNSERQNPNNYFNFMNFVDCSQSLHISNKNPTYISEIENCIISE